MLLNFYSKKLKLFNLSSIISDNKSWRHTITWFPKRSNSLLQKVANIQKQDKIKERTEQQEVNDIFELLSEDGSEASSKKNGLLDIYV